MRRKRKNRKEEFTPLEINKAQRRLKSLSGFTLVEIITVVGIIGLLAVLALPNFITSRRNARKNICINNMRNIENAIEVWATEEGKTGEDAPALSNIVPAYIKRWPACGGSSYEVPPVSGDPVCPAGEGNHKI